MARKLTVSANGVPFTAYPGEILLDAALHQGINLPHDCRSGQCGSCLVRVEHGELLGGQTQQRHVIHACQARVFSDASIHYDKLPPVRKLVGALARIERLAPDICGLTIKLQSPTRYRPGQYYRFKFRGFPSRCFSATFPLVSIDNSKTLRLHVKMVSSGAVTAKLGTDIQSGHRVIVEGPFGAAYLRPGEGQRLILVAGGTGFAPIWAIARASLRKQPHVPLLLIAGARRLSSLYMTRALCCLAAYPAADFIATTEEPQSESEIVRLGTPDQHMPELHASDLVYAAGSPRLVEVVGTAAAKVGAPFFADPFLPSNSPEPSWRLSRVIIDDLRARFGKWLPTIINARGTCAPTDR